MLLLMKLLRDAGHQCTLLAHDGGDLWRAAIGLDFEVHSASASQLWRRSGASDLVHAHDAHAHTMAALASRRRFVVSRRVAFPVGTSFASRWKYRRARRFLAVSRFVAKQLETARINPDRVDLVFDGVEEIPQAAAWSPEYPAVALASVDPMKGRDLVEAAAKTSGVAVHFSDNLPADLTRSSMFVYLTRSEGLGSAALLALQMGVPVIASQVDGLAEVFVDGVSGLYVKNETTDVIKAMRRILANPALARALIANGKSRVAECFSARQLRTNTIAAYQRALAPG